MSEIAWAAGLYDGEGSTFVSYKGLTKRGKRYQQLRCEISQTNDPAVIHRFANAIGFGSVYGPLKKKGRDHLVYKWVVSGKNARNAIDLLYPYLSEPKRRQAERAIATKEEFDRQPKLKPGPKPKKT